MQNKIKNPFWDRPIYIYKKLSVVWYCELLTVLYNFSITSSLDRWQKHKRSYWDTENKLLRLWTPALQNDREKLHCQLDISGGNKEKCSHRCSSPVPDDIHQKKWSSIRPNFFSQQVISLGNTCRHRLSSHEVLGHRMTNISKTVWQTTLFQNNYTIW